MCSGSFTKGPEKNITCTILFRDSLARKEIKCQNIDMAPTPAPAMTRSGKLLVIDDLALELPDHPIHIPIPAQVLQSRGDAEMRKFTLGVLKTLMKLPYFTWTHKADGIVIDGFTVRHNKVYPSFST